MPSASLNPETIFPYFFTIWIILAAGGFFLFHRGNDVAFKRKWFPRYVAFGSVLFIGFTVVLMRLGSKNGLPLAALTFIIPIVILIGYLNVRVIKFCDNCGKLIFPHGNFLTPAKFLSQMRFVTG